MPDLKRYWQEIRAIEATLAESVWLTSLEDKRRGQEAGCVTEVPAPAAARLIHSKSHRLSTEAEIQNYLEREQARKRDVFHEKLRARGVVIAPVERG